MTAVRDIHMYICLVKSQLTESNCQTLQWGYSHDLYRCSSAISAVPGLPGGLRSVIPVLVRYLVDLECEKRGIDRHKNDSVNVR